MNRPEELTGIVIVKQSDVDLETTYEATMPHRFGIGIHNGSPRLNVHTAYLEPGMETRAHYHVYSDGAGYLVQGEVTVVSWTHDYERVEYKLSAGDFTFTPRGFVHKMINESKTETAVVLGIYNDGEYDEDGLPLGKFYVEPPL